MEQMYNNVQVRECSKISTSFENKSTLMCKKSILVCPVEHLLQFSIDTIEQINVP